MHNMKLSIAACLLASCSVGAYEMLAGHSVIRATAAPWDSNHKGVIWSTEALSFFTPTLSDLNKSFSRVL